MTARKAKKPETAGRVIDLMEALKESLGIAPSRLANPAPEGDPLSPERLTQFMTFADIMAASKSKLDAEMGETMLSLLSSYRARGEDTELLDWMQEHGASVDVEDDECLPMSVQSSIDYERSAHVAVYNIRDALRAARASLPTQDENNGN